VRRPGAVIGQDRDECPRSEGADEEAPRARRRPLKRGAVVASTGIAETGTARRRERVGGRRRALGDGVAELRAQVALGAAHDAVLADAELAGALVIAADAVAARPADPVLALDALVAAIGVRLALHTGVERRAAIRRGVVAVRVRRTVR